MKDVFQIFGHHNTHSFSLGNKVGGFGHLAIVLRVQCYCGGCISSQDGRPVEGGLIKQRKKDEREQEKDIWTDQSGRQAASLDNFISAC